jgi:Zn-dependent peptidase ImmA (M78 family)
VKVPITPEVLRWAIKESGRDAADLANAVEVSWQTLQDWCAGSDQPDVTYFRKLAGALKRPTATFLLPAPPRSDTPAVKFRHPPGSNDRALNPSERLRLREAARLQRALRWIAQGLGEDTVGVPRASASAPAGPAARSVREFLGVSLGEQTAWKGPSAAFRAWRRALEARGVVVLAVPMGPTSTRGFSMWDDYVPLVAVNTHWDPSARIFTLLHEFGHLISRTSSVCEELVESRRKGTGDPIERWCEQLAADVLLPSDDVERFLRQKLEWNGKEELDDLGAASKVARRYRVSLRAAVLCMITIGAAKRSLYGAIPAASEEKRGGGGGSGRIRSEIRIDEYGRRTARLFVHGLRRDVLTPDDAFSYLNMSDRDWAEYERSARST